MLATTLPVASPAPLRQQVVEILRDAITNGKFERGGRLVEGELCKMLDVGRSTVREGLRQLEAEGLVTMRPNRPPVVTSLSYEQGREIYEIRAALQGLAGRLFVERASDEVFGNLREIYHHMEEAARQQDYDSLQGAETNFHNILFSNCGNQYLEKDLRQLRARVTLLRHSKEARKERLDLSLRCTGKILEAVEKSDPDATCQACHDHIKKVGEYVLATMWP